MTDHRPPPFDQIPHELRGYWDSRRKGRTIPARSDIEPGGMLGVLNHAFILERIAPGTARFRQAGSHLIDLMKMEVRGMPFCALFNTAHRGRISDVLESVFRAPQIAQLQLHSDAAFSRAALSAQMLLLPLSSDLGDITRVLGCIVTLGEIGPSPRRFDIISEEFTAVVPNAEILDPTPAPAGFSEPPGLWQPASPLQLPSSQANPDFSSESPEERRAQFRIISDQAALSNKKDPQEQ